MLDRPRRLRRNQNIRDLVQENHLEVSDFIYPLFVIEGSQMQIPISSMPGIYRWSIDLLLVELETVVALGIKAIALFPVIDTSLKDLKAIESSNPEGLTQRAIRAIKNKFPNLIVITDVALDPYTKHGHDGVLGPSGNSEELTVLNDETVELLCQMALAQAEAGSDIVAPSDMMDGRIMAIRERLDENGFEDVSIMAYTAKYASCLYGPFRDALGSLAGKDENLKASSREQSVGNSGLALEEKLELSLKNIPKDKKTYQMNPANSREALHELELDLSEAADFVMVKPASWYLDIIHQFKECSSKPVAAYQVSGEYSMIQFAAEHKIIDKEEAMLESLMAIKRAGASLILSYFAKDFANRQQACP